MPTISPIQCMRPARHFARKFVNKPSDFSAYKNTEIIEVLLKKSVFAISQPELFGKTFAQGKQQFTNLLRNGYIMPEGKAGYFIYKIEANGHTQIGLVCNQNIDDIATGKLLLHEQTKERNANFLEKRIQNLNLNFTPVYSIVPDENEEIKTALIALIQEQKADIEFETENKEKHAVYVLQEGEELQELIKCIVSRKQLYLADGHHRLAVYRKQALLKQFPAVIFPSSMVNNFSFAHIFQFINEAQLQELVALLNANTGEQIGEYFYQNQWQPIFSDEPIIDKMTTIYQFIQEQLTIQVDDERLLSLKDLYGKLSIENFAKKTDAQLVIRLNPLTIEEIIATANEGKTLPPKSTLFFPKPRAGLFITRL